MAKYNFSKEQRRKSIYGDPYDKLTGKDSMPKMIEKKKQSSPIQRLKTAADYKKVMSQDKIDRASDLATKRNIQAEENHMRGVYEENYKPNLNAQVEYYRKQWERTKRK